MKIFHPEKESSKSNPGYLARFDKFVDDQLDQHLYITNVLLIFGFMITQHVFLTVFVTVIGKFNADIGLLLVTWLVMLVPWVISFRYLFLKIRFGGKPVKKPWLK